jgi:hypothetical protein
MSFGLKICADNAAFRSEEEDDDLHEAARRTETARILREVAERLDKGYDYGLCRDINGNIVGRWSC